MNNSTEVGNGGDVSCWMKKVVMMEFAGANC